MKKEACTEAHYRCTTCSWTGPRSDAIFRLVESERRIICPTCYAECKTVHAGAPTDTEPVAALINDKTCSRCHKALPATSFYVTIVRGRATLQSKCKKCCSEYYREYNAPKGKSATRKKRQSPYYSKRTT